MLDKREKEVEAVIYTKDINRKFSLDLKKHNEQYRPVEVRTFTKAQDIIDRIQNSDCMSQ